MLILHVGAPKTGTTAIQAFLREHAPRLPEVAHPRALQMSFARHLHVYARAPRLSARDAQLLSLRSDDLPVFCDRYADMVHRSMPVHQSAVSCNELLFRLDEAAVERIAGLFGDRKMTVVMYLRRHDDLAVSLFLQAKKRGIIRREVFPTRATGYRSVIETWAQVADVKVRLYERAEMPGADAVRDFLSVIGVEPPADVTWAPERNPSWGRTQVLLGGVLDGHFPFLDTALTGGEQRLRREDLLTFLQRLSTEPLQLVTRERARSYVAGFHDDDEWVRRTYFPQRKTLFSTDFSAYPESITAHAPHSQADLTAALVELWRFREEEIAVLRGRIDALESMPKPQQALRLLRAWGRPRARSQG